MNFNEHWTKEKNKQMREFIKEGKSDKFIKDYFGEDIYHSGKYFKGNGIIYQLLRLCTDENNQLTKIIHHVLKTNESIHVVGKNDYNLIFEIKCIKYTMLLTYLYLNDTETLKLVFTRTHIQDENSNDFNYNTSELNEIDYDNLTEYYTYISKLLRDFYKSNVYNIPLVVENTYDDDLTNLNKMVISKAFSDFDEHEIKYNNIDYYIYTTK